MKQPQWLLPEVVLAVHDRLLAEFGSASAVRDVGLLESALAPPANLFAYGSATLCQLAASYAFGIVKNRPFVDGNKRTGFTTAVMFIELNARRFVATETDAIVRTLALAAGVLDEPGYGAWLESTSRPA